MKVWDTVYIRNDLIDGERYWDHPWYDHMETGEQVVSGVRSDDFDLEGSPYMYTKEMLVQEPVFTRGELVEVRYREDLSWEKRIYLNTTEWAIYPYRAVIDEESYHQNKVFSTCTRRHIRRIPKTEEMTLKQVCKELWREIKIISEQDFLYFPITWKSY